MQTFDETTFETLIDHIDLCFANILHPRCTLDLAGRFYEDLADSGRALAILGLLFDADAEKLYSDLLGNAQARRHYLARCAKHGHRDAHGASSRSEPFFDALAAQCAELALEIAALSPAEPLGDLEYEEDHHHARFLHRYIAPDATAEELTAILARFEAATAGAPSARLDVCKALLSRDQPAFDAAFDGLLEERLAAVAREKRGIAEEDVTAAIGTHVFIEGLAVLWLAQRAGILTRKEYPLCPGVARLPRRAPVPEDLFASIPL